MLVVVSSLLAQCFLNDVTYVDNSFFVKKNSLVLASVETVANKSISVKVKVAKQEAQFSQLSLR